MALNLWSKRSLVFFAAICAIVGFLVGSSSSQEAKHGGDKGEVGRYQMVQTRNLGVLIIDTKTARFWRGRKGELPENWDEHPAPWEREK